MEARRRLLLIVLGCVTIPMLGAESSTGVKLEVRKVANFEKHQGAFRVWVTVSNAGTHSVFLAKSDRKIPERLHSLGIQQWEPSRKKWRSVIPFFDQLPAGVIELKPAHSIQDSIVISDVPAHRAHEASIFIEGRHRAVLYVYRSQEDWSEGRLVLVASAPFEIHRQEIANSGRQSPQP